MGRILYAFPSRETSATKIEPFRSIVGDTRLTSCLGGTGPNGYGSIFSPSNQRGDVGYTPGKQSWFPIQGKDDSFPRYYVGWWNDDPPSPKDVLRKNIREGTVVNLSSGEWIVPHLNVQLLGIFTLPVFMESNGVDRCSFTPVPTDSYKLLCEQAGGYFNQIKQNGYFEFDPEPGVDFQFCIDVLSINYSVGNFELSINSPLKIEVSDIEKIIFAATGFTEILNRAVENQKKSNSEDQAMSGG